MVGSQSRPIATGHALVLLLCLLYYTFLISAPTYHYTAKPQPFSPSYHNSTLSEDNPLFRYNMTSSSSWIEIAHLSTNNTPVSLSVLDGTWTLLNATNVTSISGFSLIVTRAGSGPFWLEIGRLQSDVNVSITLRGWGVIPPPTIDFTVIALLPPVVFWFALLYSFYKLASIVRWGTCRGPAAIILLLFLGAAFVIPLVRGTRSHHFDPTYDLQASHEHYSLSLNESQPSVSSDLVELSPEGTSWVVFRAHNFSASAYPFLTRVTDESEQEIAFENVSQQGSWWLSFAESANRSTLLTFERISTDLEIQFTIEASYRILVEGADPFIPTVLALLGASFSILAIGLAVLLDWNYSKRSSRVTIQSSMPVK